MTLMFALLGIQCSVDSKKADAQTNSVNHSQKIAASSETQSEADKLKVKEDRKRHYEEALQDELKSLASKLHLPNLKETELDNAIEIRIWTGFGIFSPRCFVLKQNNGKYKALYVEPRFIGDKPELDAKGDQLINTIVMDAPISGWEEFDNFLKEQGIDSPMKLSLDDEPTEDASDAGAVAVEVKSGKEYSAVVFSILSKSADSQKVSKVCQKIKQEFNVEMGCSNG